MSYPNKHQRSTLSKTPKYLTATKIASLGLRDPRFAHLIRLIKRPQFKIPAWNTIEEAILYAVIGQMLSASAARSIIGKLKVSFPDTSTIFRWAVKTANKSGPLHGVSQRKRRALAEWHQFSIEHPDRWLSWKSMPLDDYRKEVSNIWGFGRWASDVLAIFYLERSDVWAVTDGGIIRSTKLHFNGASPDRITKYIVGHETLATLFLWEALNRKVVVLNG
jgi:3-methyladenine DNA glycosylase/8-oxoguanine DNA glycosylase